MGVKLVSSSGGSVELNPPTTASNSSLTVPANNGTVITTASSGQVIPKTALPAGTVLQVVSVTKTDTFTTSSTTFVDITGLSASITPTSATSKILIFAQIAYSGNNATGAHFKIVGGNAANYLGQAAGSRVQTVFGGWWNTNLTSTLISAPLNYLDSPSTASSVTYSIQTRKTPSGPNPSQINFSIDNADNSDIARGASTITLMEIAA